MLEMHGIKYISTARPGSKRGGGAAIAVRQENFTLSKLNIFIPKSVENVCDSGTSYNNNSMLLLLTPQVKKKSRPD